MSFYIKKIKNINYKKFIMNRFKNERTKFNLKFLRSKLTIEETKHNQTKS